jgi:hypothetical protein
LEEFSGLFVFFCMGGRRGLLIPVRLRARICRASSTKPLELRRFAVDRLKDRDVASRYYDELESEHQGVQAQPLSLDEKCKKTGRNNPESSDKHHRLHEKRKKPIRPTV